MFVGWFVLNEKCHGNGVAKQKGDKMTKIQYFQKDPRKK